MEKKKIENLLYTELVFHHVVYTMLLMQQHRWSLQNSVFTLFVGFTLYYQIKDERTICCGDIYRHFQRKTFSTFVTAALALT